VAKLGDESAYLHLKFVILGRVIRAASEIKRIHRKSVLKPDQPAKLKNVGVSLLSGETFAVSVQVT